MTDSFDRRSLLALASLSAIGLPALAKAQTPPTPKPGAPDPMAIPADAPVVAILIHPRMVMLDLIGPMTALNILRCRINLVWKDTSPVTTELGLPLVATQTFAECPRDLDVLMVPGGMLGSVACMNDPEVMAFLADRGSRATWVSSVCTGGLTIAAAGLLKGYDANATWTISHLLPLMGARHVAERVVVDRNRMTCGGVTAGIDLGLTLAAKLRGDEAAKRVQLLMEYAPEPPFHSGTPAQAPELAAAIRQGTPWMQAQARGAAEAAGKRLGIMNANRSAALS